MRRLLLCCALLLGLLRLSHAGNTLGSTNVPEVVQEYLATLTSSYAVKDCLPTLATVTNVLPATPCTAMILAEGSPPRLMPVVQDATAIGPLDQGDGLYWIAVHTDTSTAIPGWIRTAGGVNRAGSHYVWQKAATKPALAAAMTFVAKVGVTSLMITRIDDLRTPVSYAMKGVYDPKDPLYGALADRVHDDTAAVQAAENARSAQVVGGVLQFSPGSYILSAPIIIKSPGTIQGQDRSKTSLISVTGTADTLNTSGFPGGASSALTIRDLTFEAGVAKTAGAAIHAVTATPTEPAQQMLHVRDTIFQSQFTGIHLGNSTYARIVGNTLSGVTGTGILVAITSNWDEGDIVIEGNTIGTTPPAGARAILLQTSGQRVVNNKILGFPIGILVDPLVVPALGDIMIANNSIENVSQYGILVQTSLDGTQVNNLHITGNQMAVPLATGTAWIAVSGQIINAAISHNVLFHSLPNVYGIQLATDIHGRTPANFSITGNVVTGQNGTNSTGIQIPNVTDNRGIVAGNFVSGWPHPYAGIGGAVTAGAVQPGNLPDFGGQGSVVYCVSCMVTSPTNNICTAGGGGALAVKLDDGAWHCFALQN